MFARLRLWTRFIPGDEEQCSIHDSSTVQHGSHKNIVTWTVDKRYMSKEMHCATTAWTLTGWIVFLTRGIWSIASRPRTCFVIAFIYLPSAKPAHLRNLGVCISKFNGDVSLNFVFESDRVDTWDCLDDGWLSVCYMTYSTDIDCSLSITLAKVAWNGQRVYRDMTSGEVGVNVDGSTLTVSTGFWSKVYSCSSCSWSAILAPS